MRPAQSCLAFVALAVLAPGSYSQDAQPPGKEQPVQAPYRCAYVGTWGSFHLIGNGGSAAYALGNDQYVGDLRFTGQDADHRYYTPTKGDASTTRWAFAQRPDNCGLYAVWREDQGKWRLYERVRAWGEGLGRVTTASTEVSVEARIADLERRVGILEKK